MTETAPEAAPTLPDDVRASFLEVVPDPPADQSDGGKPLTVTPGVRRVDLGDGEHAILRDPRTLRSGDRKKVYDAIPDEKPMLSRGLSLIDGIAMIAIESWSLPLPLPKDDPAVAAGEGFANSLDRLTFEQADLLNAELDDYRKILFPRTSDNPGEPGTGPTAPSAG